MDKNRSPNGTYVLGSEAAKVPSDLWWARPLDETTFIDGSKCVWVEPPSSSLPLHRALAE